MSGVEISLWPQNDACPVYFEIQNGIQSTKEEGEPSKRLDIGNLKAHFLNLTCFVNNYCATQFHLDFHP